MDDSTSTPPYAAALRRALLEGKSPPEAARAAGVSRRTAFRWLAAHRLELAAAELARSPALRFLRPLAVTGRPRGAR